LDLAKAVVIAIVVVCVVYAAAIDSVVFLDGNGKIRPGVGFHEGALNHNGFHPAG